MTREGLINELAELGYCRNQSREVINDIFRIIGEHLVSGEICKVKGFGVFEVKRREGHMIQDVRTKELKRSEDYSVITFKPGDNLRDAVKSGDPSRLTMLTNS